MAATAMLAATPRYIGMIAADGRLWVDSAGVSNHATVFDGTVVETEEVPAKLRLASGASIWLDVATRADVFQDHLLLEKGRAQLDEGSGFRIDAGKVRVMLASPVSRAMVSKLDSGAVQVATLAGEAQVRNAQDVVVARVDPGRPVELHSDSSGGSVVTGCVSKLGQSLVLQDEVSGVTVELRGKGLNDYVGKRIQVTGVALEPGATADAQQVIQANGLKLLATSCPASLTASTAAGGIGSRERSAPVSPGTASGVSGAGGASAGISAPAAVLGGVGVAAASAAAVHAITAKKHKPPISRGR